MDIINNCTPRKPMPEGRHQMGQTWYHHGSKAKEGEPPMLKEGDSQIWKCPNCGHEFRVTRTGKISKAEVIRKSKEMRERGLRHV